MKTLIVSICLFVVLTASVVLADGDITLNIPVGGHVDFNLGPVSDVSIAEVHMVGTDTHSLFDCDGTPSLAAPVLFVDFDGEGLVDNPPSLQYVFFEGPFDFTLSMAAPDPDSWDIIHDGVARIYAETWVHEAVPGCTLDTLGSLDFDENQVTVRLVYTSLVAAEETVWGRIKTMYR